jgi:linoleoyl-CoA desaturase
VYKDYVFFPLLGFWNAPRILAGNLVANLARNVWTAAIIFCGHFPDGARMYTRQETRHETRGEWYLRQIQGSANIEGSRAFHVLSGHLSHQIEHHLFPDLPAHRYPEIAPRVRAICERYGLPYNSASFWTQYGSVVRNLFRYALPDRPSLPAVLPEAVAAV